MSIKSILKMVVKKWGGVTRYFPFINRISLHGTRLSCSGAVFWRTRINCKGSHNSINIDEGCILRNCVIHICGNSNQIMLASGVHATNAEIWIEDDGNIVKIGKGTSLCGRIHLACIEGQTIAIGEKCLFSSDIVFRTGDSHSVLDDQGRRINESKSICIGDHVWIGNRATINKGVRIGKNSIVGNGAIVTKPYSEEGVVLAGVPAKVVKRNINWDPRRI